MLRSLALLPLALILAAAGCNGSKSTASSDVQAAATGDPFQLALGESVEVDGHSLRFIDVVEDSRCPTGVECVWEGRAKVQLAASNAEGAEDRRVLTLPYGTMTDDESDTWSVGGLSVRLLDLLPHPTAEGDHPTPRTVELSVTPEG